MQIRFFLSSVRRKLSRTENKTALAWLLGLLLGALACAYTDIHFLSKTLPVPFVGSSVSALVSSAVLPFLIAAYSAISGWHCFLPLLCLIRGFLFSFCGCWIYRAYGSAGWLFRFMLQFSEICTAPLFCLFCLRCSRARVFQSRELFLYAALAVFFVCIDFFVISPFWAEIV